MLAHFSVLRRSRRFEKAPPSLPGRPRACRRLVDLGHEVSPKTRRSRRRRSQLYTRCPRSIAAKAEEYLQKSGIGDVAYFGPEAKFYIFDNVRFGTDPNNMFFEADAMKRRADKDCSLIAPINPIDPAQDMRTEMLAMMEQLGVNVEKHRHERLTSQHLIGISHAPLLQAADNIQLYKYVMHNVAHSYHKSGNLYA